MSDPLAKRIGLAKILCRSFALVNVSVAGYRARICHRKVWIQADRVLEKRDCGVIVAQSIMACNHGRRAGCTPAFSIALGPENDYFSFAYSARDCFRMARSASASFHNTSNCSYDLRAAALFPLMA